MMIICNIVCAILGTLPFFYYLKRHTPYATHSTYNNYNKVFGKYPALKAYFRSLNHKKKQQKKIFYILENNLLEISHNLYFTKEMP